MSKRSPVRGYRSRRSGGLVTPFVWLGILLNMGLIVYSVASGQGFAFGMLNGNLTDAAVRAINSGDLYAAVGHAQAALQADPNDTAAAVALVRALVYRSYTDLNRGADIAAALDAAKIAVARHPAEPDAQAAYAFALVAEGDYLAAVEVANTVLAEYPTHTLARTALALGYARAGSFDIARRESAAAIEGDPTAPEVLDARRALAISTADLGEYAAAGTMLDEMLREHRGFIPLHFERALYAKQVSDTARAESAYFAVLTLDPNNVKARLRLCEMTSNIGEADTARTYCGEVTTLAPNLPEGWYRLGRLHFLAGEFGDAQAALNVCSTLQVRQGVPPSERIFECWYLQGQSAEMQGDCDALMSVYAEFQLMAADAAVRETWVMPPDGPPICAGG